MIGQRLRVLLGADLHVLHGVEVSFEPFSWYVPKILVESLPSLNFFFKKENMCSLIDIAVP